MNKTQLKLFWWVFGIVTALGVVIVTAYFLTRPKEKQAITQTTESSSISSTSKSTTATSELSEDEMNYRLALAALEHSDQPIKEQELFNRVERTIQEAVDYCKNVQYAKDLTFNSDNHLGSSDTYAAMGFAVMVMQRGGNFQYDNSETEIYAGEADDVVQAIVVLKKNGQPNAYFVFNINTYSQGININSHFGSNYEPEFG